MSERDGRTDVKAARMREWVYGEGKLTKTDSFLSASDMVLVVKADNDTEGKTLITISSYPPHDSFHDVVSEISIFLDHPFPRAE